jgi:hypothetical protein
VVLHLLLDLLLGLCQSIKLALHQLRKPVRTNGSNNRWGRWRTLRLLLLLLGCCVILHWLRVLQGLLRLLLLVSHDVAGVGDW